MGTFLQISLIFYGKTENDSKSPAVCNDATQSPLRKQVLATKAEAERDGVKVPTTLAEYCVRTRAPAPDEGSDLFYDYCYDEDDVEGEDGDCCYDEDDSGNEES